MKNALNPQSGSKVRRARLSVRALACVMVLLATANAQTRADETSSTAATPVSWETTDSYPAQLASTYVPLDHWAYSLFDRLSARGLIQTSFAGMRPWTRFECAGLVNEARRIAGAAASAEIALLEQEFAAELGMQQGRRQVTTVESVYLRTTGISGEPISDGFHFVPTVANDYGRPFASGFNLVTGISASVHTGPFMAYVRGEYQHVPEREPLPESAKAAIRQEDGVPIILDRTGPWRRGRLLEAYVGLQSHNLQLTVGRQSLWWGPSESGAFMLSNNAEPILMARLSRVAPLVLPSVLRLLGPVRGEVFLGRLEGHRYFYTNRTGLVGPSDRYDAYIHGQKISFKPTPNLEFGFSRTGMFGGPGLPFTSRNLWKSVFSTGNTSPGQSGDPGDRRSGFDFRYRMPGLRKWLVLYSDSLVEDEYSPIAYPRKSMFNPGVYLPQIPKIPKLDLRIEGMYTDVPGAPSEGIYGFNVMYRSGYTNYGNIIGHWIGREAHALEATSTYWVSPRSKLQLSYRAARMASEFMDGGTQMQVRSAAVIPLLQHIEFASTMRYERSSFPSLSPKPVTNLSVGFRLTVFPRLAAGPRPDYGTRFEINDRDHDAPEHH